MDKNAGLPVGVHGAARSAWSRCREWATAFAWGVRPSSVHVGGGPAGRWCRRPVVFAAGPAWRWRGVGTSGRGSSVVSSLRVSAIDQAATTTRLRGGWLAGRDRIAAARELRRYFPGRDGSSTIRRNGDGVAATSRRRLPTPGIAASDRYGRDHESARDGDAGVRRVGPEVNAIVQDRRTADAVSGRPRAIGRAPACHRPYLSPAMAAGARVLADGLAGTIDSWLIEADRRRGVMISRTRRGRRCAPATPGTTSCCAVRHPRAAASIVPQAAARGADRK